MKKFLILFLLFFCSVSLFAATSRKANIFVPSVDGGRQRDAAFFHRQITHEVALHYYAIERNKQNSDFMLRGTIELIADIDLRRALKEKRIARTLEIIEEYKRNLHKQGEYIFTLELVNTATEESIAEQYLVYSSSEDKDLAELVSVIVDNLLASLPDITETENWREKWLFVGLNALWLPRVYVGDYKEINWATYGLSIYFELHFSDNLSVSLEPQFVRDWVVVSLNTGEQYTDLLFEIPITIKFVGKWFKSLTLEPYAGIAFNISTMGTTSPSLLSWLAGLQFGIKAGAGMVVIDPRFAMDFSKSHLPQNENKIEYSRYMIQLALGYKIGFVPK